LAVILSRFPYPLEKGDKLRAYYQLVELSVKFEIYLFCTTETEIEANHFQKIESLCEEVHVFRLKPLIKLFNLFRAFLDDKPFQVRYFHQKWIQRAIDKRMKSIQPDHIYCQLIRASEYVKNYHSCPKTLDYMDALSKGIERRMDTTWGPRKWLFQQENKRLGQYERQIFDYFENHTIISEQDRNFILHPSKGNIVIIPNGVNDSFFESKESTIRYDLLFTGNMGYPPNVEAAEFIATQIIPSLISTNPAVRCLISGANPDSRLQQFSSAHFEIGGWVEDIRSSYSTSSIFIAPMFIGTGLQNKLLEAMAMGLPCITTSLANNALRAIPEQQLLIANDAKSFVKQIERLQNDAVFRRKIAEAGKNFVRENYQWNKVTDSLIELLS
jgi:glycosyltransferase involved in cell wall biosynthesis